MSNKKELKIKRVSKKWFGSLLQRRVMIIVILLVQIFCIVYSLLSGSITSKIILNALQILSLIAVLHVVSVSKNGSYKLIWVFLILIAPLFGGALYLLVNTQSSTKRFRNAISHSEHRSREYYKLYGDAHDEAVKEYPQASASISYLGKYAGFPIYKGSTAEYLESGERKLEMLLPELEKAKKYIFLEYFIVQEGTMWDSILEVLKRKAAEGVKVRLIYDDLGCFFKLPNNYPEEMKKYGIECQCFNPFRPILSVVQNNRDHRKIISIDGKVCFTGGINLADEYINAIKKFGHWKDSAIMVSGRAAWSFTLIFLQMWELCTGKEEDFSQFEPWQDESCTVPDDGFVQPYADSPLDNENVGEQVYLQIINNAKKYVYIATPYLIIDDSMITALTLAAKSGVDVRIVTPHVWDKFLVHVTTRSYYPELIRAGVKIYEYSKGFIHSKNFISDDFTATVGTVNLDFRSLYLHFECGVQLYGSKAIADVKADYLETLKDCRQITEEECKKNLFMRLIQHILRLFAPLM